MGFIVMVGVLHAATLMVAVQSSPAVTGPRYELSSLTFDLNAGDTLGIRRSGTFCLPSGEVHWRDARVNTEEAIAAAAKVLKTRVDLPTGDGRGDPIYVRGQVVLLGLSPCLPPGGLGKILNRSTTIKGRGSIKVRWAIDKDGRYVDAVELTTCSKFTFKEEGASLSDMTLAGVRASAADLGSLLARSPNDETRSNSRTSCHE